MELRVLGSTGLRVSALGFGAGAVGGLLVRGDAPDQTRAIARAFEAGVTYFDTAPSYGNGLSEQNLGRVLRSLRAWDRVVVGTKVRLEAPDLSHPFAAIQRSCEESLRRLGRDAVDLLQLHNPIASAATAEVGVGASRPISPEAVGVVVEGLRRIVRLGRARHIGITGLGDTPALHSAAAGGEFETLQAYFNAVNPSAGFPHANGGAQDFDGLIGAAAAAGMGVIAIRVMAAGALAAQVHRHRNAGDPGPPLLRGADYARDRERARAVQTVAAEAGLESSLELGIRFALAMPGISTVLVGFSDLAHVEDALRWTARGPLPADVVHRVVDLAR